MPALKKKIAIEVIQPSVCDQAMCVYKFTLDNGFYYYGATSNLLNRIHNHVKKYRDGKLTGSFKSAFSSAKSITFEFIRFSNSRKELKEKEEYFLSQNVGNDFCLNKDFKSTSNYKKEGSTFKVAKIFRSGEISEIFDSPKIAGIALGRSIGSIRMRVKSKYPYDGYFLRYINYKDEIINFPDLKIKDPQAVPVEQYDLNMNFIAEYSSIGEASRIIGRGFEGISLCVKGKLKTSGGFIFKAKE